MARSRTLTQLIADVRDRADIENSLHITDTQVTRYVNQSIAALHALIVEQDEDEFAEETILAVTAGTVQTSILAGGLSPYKVLGVDVVDSNGASFQVRRFMVGERAELESQRSSAWFATRYRLRGLNAILFAPPFDRDVNVRVTYVEPSEDLVAPTDAYDGRDGWEEWVTVDAAIKCLDKEESDSSALVRERALIWDRISKQIAARDRAQPARVRDVRGGEWW
jgi:hypothetical protein